MFSKIEGFVPPRKGTSVLYICQKCGKHFFVEKSVLPKPVKCPDCKSFKCISPVMY